jgi:hypothetical protein
MTPITPTTNNTIVVEITPSNRTMERRFRTPLKLPMLTAKRTSRRITTHNFPITTEAIPQRKRIILSDPLTLLLPETNRLQKFGITSTNAIILHHQKAPSSAIGRDLQNSHFQRPRALRGMSYAKSIPNLFGSTFDIANDISNSTHIKLI